MIHAVTKAGRDTIARLLVVVVVAVASLTLPQVAAGATPEQVDKAVTDAVKFLYDKQNDRGTWDIPRRTADSGSGTNGGQWGGRTALMTYALLAAGESPEDPRLARAIKWLEEAEIVGVYAIGMRAQVWANLPDTPESRRRLLREAQFFAEAIQKDGANRGLFDYLVVQNNRVDKSAAQYGVLGLWAVAQRLEVPPALWAETEQGWLRWQQPDGGWAYSGKPTANKPTTPALACAGLASLFITQDYLHADQGVNCRGNVTNPAIQKGLNFLAKDIDKVFTKGWKDHQFYTIYGIERVGVASGLKYIGNTDWFETGSEFLVKNQNGNGSWGNEVDTAFALLFLSYGRAPVLANKLHYTLPGRRGDAEEGNWNQRPRDLANVTRYIGDNLERHLNWQVLELKRDVREFHDAPLLYISGDQALNFTDEEVAKLRQYVEEGGVIVANPDCRRNTFERGFKALGERMFPEYKFRRLPADHPIYTAQQFRDRGRRAVDFDGLSNGTRELMLIATNDVARDWQVRDTSRAEESFQAMANVYLYAVDKSGINVKGTTHLLAKRPEVKTTGKLTVARVKYEGNWNPEPAGWVQMQAVAHNDLKADLKVEAVETSQLDPKQHPVAHLTGTGDVTLSDKQIGELAAYAQAGGLLVIDAAGGDRTFAAAVQSKLRSAFGEAGSGLDTPLPMSHALFTGSNLDADKIDYRLHTRREVVGALRGSRLRGITLDGRLAVVFSSEDLSTGMVGMPVDGIIGYAPQTARDLTKAILKFAMEKK
ncbi:MAG: DUF4159 domain-containing protein [Phycisphaerae bacterium]